MFKMRYADPGTAPATLTPFAPGEASEPVLTLIEYNAEYLEERKVATVAELPEPDESCVRWIDMSGLGSVEVLKALGEKYDLHPLALEDVLHTGQRPKTEPYDQHLFIVGQMLYNDEEGILCTEQISFFLRPNLLITIQEEARNDVFTPVRERLRGGKRFIRKQGADYLAYALLDAMIDHCFPALEELGEAVEELENVLLSNPSPDCVRTLHGFRRTLMVFRRFVWPERDVISALMHDESGLIAAQTKVYLRDCYDHTIQIMDLIESYRDITSGLLEMYLSCVSMRTNEIMRVLTVVSSIFIPLTFVAGLYGMNFDFEGGKMPWNMPELHKPWGYIACLGVMLAISIVQVLFFRRKKWL
ncbi:MAG: zntB [Chthoniobacteraceae bacterium]|nr:zntB [Chthoniobacteraceae bacterium]